MDNYKISREQQPWGRSYVIETADKKFAAPSVTTILKLLTEPKFAKIKEEFGDERWQKILDDASYRGNIMHSMMEHFLLEYSKEKNVDKSLEVALEYATKETRKDPRNKHLIQKGRDLFWNFYYDKFWEGIEIVLHNELFLWTDFRGGWAGATDFVFGDFHSDHIMIDFKSSSSPKSAEDIEQYFCQISAYMFMYAERTGVLPKRGEIWISNEKDNEIQKFVVKDTEFKTHLRKFLSLHKEFLEKYNLAA